MFENVGTSTSRNPKGLNSLYRDNFTLLYHSINLSRHLASWPKFEVRIREELSRRRKEEGEREREEDK
jgi:hypothetical protein